MAPSGLSDTHVFLLMACRLCDKGLSLEEMDSGNYDDP
jgi:hypothetical protein